jgi:high-affinity nickel-transport protein
MNPSLLAIGGLGFLLGMRHASDPDHVVAVTTIVAHQRGARRAAMIGGMWGIGHTLTILLVGGGIILFQWAIPVRVGLSMEFSVALMLILLGVLNLRGGAAPHAHDEADHAVSYFDQHFRSSSLYQLIRPLMIGIVHGLAGSAAVALLVLTQIRDPWWGVAYLLIFGVGTIAGMMVITAAIAVPFGAAGARGAKYQRALRLATGALSLVFGVWVAWRIGVVDGLFSAHPVWTPE